MNNHNFTERVIKVVAGIRSGETMTYKQVAVKAGSPKAYRAVGNILNSYYEERMRNRETSIPCHRVIRSDGKLGGYAKGEAKKRKILKAEGIFRNKR